MIKSPIIFILILSIMFISGCVDEEKTEIPMKSQNTQESNTLPTGSILRSSDVLELTLISNNFYSVPKNTLYTTPDQWIMMSSRGWDFYRGAKQYTDTLLMGYRNVGEDIYWRDQSGKELSISVVKYDSDPDSFLIGWVNPTLLSDAELEALGADISDPNIGDYSRSVTSINPDTDVHYTEIRFVHDTTFVVVSATNEKGISKKTAIRIAKIIEARLD